MRTVPRLLATMSIGAALVRCSSFGSDTPDASVADATAEAAADSGLGDDAAPDAGAVDARGCVPDAHYRCEDFDEPNAALPLSFDSLGGTFMLDDTVAFSGKRSIVATSPSGEARLSWETTDPIGNGVLRAAVRRESFSQAQLDTLAVIANGPVGRAACALEQVEPNLALLQATWTAPDGGVAGNPPASIGAAAVPKGTWASMTLEFRFDDPTPRCLAYLDGNLAGSTNIPSMPPLVPTIVQFDFGNVGYATLDGSVPSITRFDDLVVDKLP